MDFPAAIASETATDDTSLDDADYENDEGNDQYDDEYESNEQSNGAKKLKKISSRMEVELGEKADTTTSKASQVESVTTVKPTNLVSKTTKVIRLPSETLPDGFKGKIDDKRQKQQPVSPTNKVNGGDAMVNVKPDSYVTVTKSVSGSLDNSKTAPADDKKFESTYYSKTSTCGYFTFSCNIVYNSNGRKKICKKIPTNGKC